MSKDICNTTHTYIYIHIDYILLAGTKRIYIYTHVSDNTICILPEYQVSHSVCHTPHSTLCVFLDVRYIYMYSFTYMYIYIYDISHVYSCTYHMTVSMHATM